MEENRIPCCCTGRMMGELIMHGVERENDKVEKMMDILSKMIDKNSIMCDKSSGRSEMIDKS